MFNNLIPRVSEINCINDWKKTGNHIPAVVSYYIIQVVQRYYIIRDANVLLCRYRFVELRKGLYTNKMLIGII